ncbi:oligosaccharide flippase family protein [Flavobacterium channae]|uniref:oligosaccharide flippase family protein n=1 Tax=Flavobacterium channae TaxID=2897181 RepID=UPI001E33C346|nr:oligosaccharide flippase family protein [Flavobacterium channae]UGS24359.1 oligosaccharide flippase family protein [Flavobacterium channae]
MQEKNFHNLIFKSTRIFGASHLVKVGTKVITNKIAAIYLGAVGIGIIGIVENLLSILFGLVNFGLTSSSVREIALLNYETEEAKAKESRMISIIYYWSLFSGFLGAVFFVLISYSFFKNTYPTDSSYLWFVSIALYFVFFALFSARMSILQGKREINKMVQIQVVISIIQMLLAIGCYYFFGLNGIAIAILFTAIVSFLVVYFSTKNTIRVEKNNLTLKQVFSEGLPMVKLGIILSLGTLINQLAFYVIRLFLKDFLSIEALGVFQVSYTVLVGYLGIIFVVMSNDFYPQLCNLESDKPTFEKYINDQTQFALYLVVPLVLLMYLIAPQLVVLLYSNSFLDVLLILKIALIGLIFKTIAWPIGFISLVKGNKKLFFKQNLLSDIINVVCSVVFTYYFGLKGLGMAFALMFLVSLFYNFFTVNKNYNFSYSTETKRIIVLSMVIGAIALLSFNWFDFSYMNPVIWGLFILTSIYAVVKLKNKIQS